MWYKWAQEQPEWEITPDQWGISHQQVADMIRRTTNLVKPYLEPGETLSDDSLILEANNNFEIYKRFLQNLPHDIDAADVIRAYRANLLPQTLAPKQRTPYLDIRNPIDLEADNLPWASQTYSPLSAEELQTLLVTASARATKTNSENVNAARYQLLLASFKDKDIYSKLGIKRGDLNKMLRSWSNLPAKSIQLEQMMNYNMNPTTEWCGISNSSFLSLQQVNPEDIDGFFANITIDENAPEWYSKEAIPLRRYILQTVMAIDMHFSYENLAFEIKDATEKVPMGQYRKNRIIIYKNGQNTVAHEIGHHIDTQWASDILGFGESLTETTIQREMFDPEIVQFFDIFHEFLYDIAERSNISSEYYQRLSEVFARFVASFVSWTIEKAGGHTWDREIYNDKFNESDYSRFIKILQMKAYLDVKKAQNAKTIT